MKLELFFFSQKEKKNAVEEECWARNANKPHLFFKIDWNFPVTSGPPDGHSSNLKLWLKQNARKNTSSTLAASAIFSDKWLTVKIVFMSVVACLFFSSAWSCIKDESKFLLKQIQKGQKRKKSHKEKAKIPERQSHQSRSRRTNPSRSPTDQKKDKIK
eukprot:GHVP01041483.1.p1 GENE.GHVP01041483.1~~GHVP01041483.1.p1  ORF type:complete len:158 (+),score=29.36 GHVP01041483.1:349-822(+)